MLTITEWAVVTAHHQRGESISAIARYTGHSRGTIRRALKRIDNERLERQATAHAIARRALVSSFADIKKKVNGRLLPAYPSAASIRTALARIGMKVARSTVYEDLKLTHDSVVRPLRPFDGERAERLRAELKEHFLEDEEDYDFDLLVFSDEHFISTNDHTTRTMWVRKASGGTPRASPIPRIVQSRYNIPSIMIWAAIGIDYRTPLIFLPKQKKEDGGTLGMNSKRYVKVCLSKLFGASNPLPEGRLFMQDGAKCHTAKHTMLYLERKGQDVLLHWPPYSPDLNPIENLWAYLDTLIAARAPRTFEELKRIAQEEWEKIPTEVINNFVRSFKSKLETKID